MSYVERPGKPVFRHGKRIETIELVPPASPIRRKRRRKAFEVKFVKVPVQWIKTLWQTKNPGTWRLAMVILAEDFKRKHLGGEIVLSSQVTQMPDTTRIRAARELVSLGLIQLEPGISGRSAPKVLVVQKLKVARTVP
jgi:hypothetical protein